MAATPTDGQGAVKAGETSRNEHAVDVAMWRACLTDLRPGVPLGELIARLEASLAGSAPDEVTIRGIARNENHEADREKWLSHEIPNRYAGLKADPTKGIPLAAARGRFERRHSGDGVKAKQERD